MNFTRGLAVLLLCFSVLAHASLWAQATAQISGTVRNQAGAVTGAVITVTQTGTGIIRSTTTGKNGSYALPNLAIGPYRLQAVLPGFRTHVRTGIVLHVNSSPVIDVELEAGPVTEQVEVQANTAMVETRNSSAGQVFESEQILGLPLNGRNAAQLSILAGTAVQTGTLRDGAKITLQ